MVRETYSIRLAINKINKYLAIIYLQRFLVTPTYILSRGFAIHPWSVIIMCRSTSSRAASLSPTIGTAKSKIYDAGYIKARADLRSFAISRLVSSFSPSSSAVASAAGGQTFPVSHSTRGTWNNNYLIIGK